MKSLISAILRGCEVDGLRDSVVIFGNGKANEDQGLAQDRRGRMG